MFVGKPAGIFSQDITNEATEFSFFDGLFSTSLASPSSLTTSSIIDFSSINTTEAPATETTASLFNLIIESLVEKMALDIDLPSESATEQISDISENPRNGRISDISDDPTTTQTSDIIDDPATERTSDISENPTTISGVTAESLLSGEPSPSPPNSLQLNSEMNQTFSDVLFTSLSDLSKDANLKTESNGVHIERAITLLETVRGGQVGDNKDLPTLSRLEGQEPSDQPTPLTTPERKILSPDKKENGSFPGSQIFRKENGRIVIRRLKKKKIKQKQHIPISL